MATRTKPGQDAPQNPPQANQATLLPSPAAFTLQIQVPLSRVVSKRYMSGRCDTDLTRSEQIIMRRIQDALEDSGKHCGKGPTSVLRHLLSLIVAAESEQRA